MHKLCIAGSLASPKGCGTHPEASKYSVLDDMPWIECDFSISSLFCYFCIWQLRENTMRPLISAAASDVLFNQTANVEHSEVVNSIQLTPPGQAAGLDCFSFLHKSFRFNSKPQHILLRLKHPNKAGKCTFSPPWKNHCMHSAIFLPLIISRQLHIEIMPGTLQYFRRVHRYVKGLQSPHILFIFTGGSRA